MTFTLVGEQRKDDTQEVCATSVAGLEQFLYERYLESHLRAAEAWCKKMGAVLLEEIVEEIDAFASDLELKPFERKRLVGGPRAREAPTATVAPCASPAVPCSAPMCPAPAEHKVCVKNTFVHYPEPVENFDRSETCPAETVFLKAMTRLVSGWDRVRSCEEASEAWADAETATPADTEWTTPADTVTATPAETVPTTPRDDGFATVPQKKQRKSAQAPQEKPKKKAKPFFKQEKATVDVPVDRVGVLIGSKGSTLLSIEAKTGATISVPKQVKDKDAEDKVRSVVIHGSSAAIAAAKQAIAAVVKDPDFTDLDALEARVAGFEAAKAAKVAAAEKKYAFAAPKAKQQSVTVKVWEAQVSALVGVGGKTVRAIEELSGARISIPKEGWVREVVARGDAESRAEALKMIENTLPITTTLEVPAWKVGALIGYKGEMIRDIQNWSHATVSVPREGDVREVVICGETELSVRRAVRAIEQELQHAKDMSKTRSKKAKQDAKETSKKPKEECKEPERIPCGQGDAHKLRERAQRNFR